MTDQAESQGPHTENVYSDNDHRTIAIGRINGRYRMRLFRMRQRWRRDCTTPSAEVLEERQNEELMNDIACLKAKAEYLSNALGQRLFRVDNSH